MGFALAISFISPWLSMIFLILRGRRINFQSQKICKMFPLVFAIIIGSLGYCFYQEKGDLGRLAYVLDKLKNNSISYLTNESIRGSIGQFNIWFYLSAKADDYNLMTGVAAFVMYYVMAKNIAATSSHMKANNKNSFMAGLCCFIGVQFVQVLPIGRSMAAFSILLLAVYRELFQNKRDITTAVLYILPIMLHTGSIVLYLLRLVLPLFFRYTKLCVCIGSISTNIIPFAYKIRNIFPIFIAEYLEKANSYYMGKHAYGVYTLTNRYHRTIKFLYIIIIIIVLLLYFFMLKNEKREIYHSNIPKGHKLYLYYLLEIVILTIACFWIKSDTYYRFINLLLVGLPCLLLYAEKYIKKFVYQILIYLFLFVACLLQIAGNWCGILNGQFELINTPMQNIFFNIPYIAVKDIMTIIIG